MFIKIQRRKREMSNMDPTTQMLILVLACAVVVLFVLSIVYIILKAKERKIYDNKEEEIESSKKTTGNTKTVNGQVLGKKSIFDFMEFDKIEDNMIIQKGRKKIHNGCRMPRY